MFKRAKVVMLPTNEKAENCLVERFNRISFQKGYFTQEYLQYNEAKSFHLYILSDEVINKDDYYELDGQIFQMKRDIWTDIGGRKIIATTDKSLVVEGKALSGDVAWRHPFPQPSQSFIQKYIEEYNKGNTITDVMVEYHPELYDGTEITAVLSGRLKINTKDNTITIRKVKDNWNREEVIDLVMTLTSTPSYISKESATSVIDKWVEKNL